MSTQFCRTILLISCRASHSVAPSFVKRQSASFHRAAALSAPSEHVEPISPRYWRAEARAEVRCEIPSLLKTSAMMDSSSQADSAERRQTTYSYARALSQSGR